MNLFCYYKFNFFFSEDYKLLDLILKPISEITTGCLWKKVCLGFLA